MKEELSEENVGKSWHEKNPTEFDEKESKFASKREKLRSRIKFPIFSI